MPYTTVEKVLLLQNVDLLSASRTEDLAAIATIADEVLYPAGATVFEEGQPADALYVVITGELVLTRDGNLHLVAEVFMDIHRQRPRRTVHRHPQTVCCGGGVFRP